MNLIHADLKPDNFLVTDFPGLHNRALQMIDFGKALDMQLVRGALDKHTGIIGEYVLFFIPPDF